MVNDCFIQIYCILPKKCVVKEIFISEWRIGDVHAVCLEGSLKLKEISYIHSEAYAAGELKHGTISLIEQGTLIIGVLTQSELYEKTISNMLEYLSSVRILRKSSKRSSAIALHLFAPLTM